jgi:hypothetical protein
VRSGKPSPAGADQRLEKGARRDRERRACARDHDGASAPRADELRPERDTLLLRLLGADRRVAVELSNRLYSRRLRAHS